MKRLIIPRHSFSIDAAIQSTQIDWSNLLLLFVRDVPVLSAAAGFPSVAKLVFDIPVAIAPAVYHAAVDVISAVSIPCILTVAVVSAVASVPALAVDPSVFDIFLMFLWFPRILGFPGVPVVSCSVLRIRYVFPDP